MNVEDFRASLQAKLFQFGLFCCSYSPQAVEAIAGSGYEFLIFDTEHCPNDLVNLHTQLLALAHSKTAAVIRTTGVDAAQIKRLLDRTGVARASSLDVTVSESLGNADHALTCGQGDLAITELRS